MKRFVETLKRQAVKLKHIKTQLEHTSQISLTDPEARAITTSTSRGLVGYNVQTSLGANIRAVIAS